MKSITFHLNDATVVAKSEHDTPLLWVLREEFKLNGTKYGCGIGQCGACTVLMDGKAVRSCLVRLESLEGKAITTIEGITSQGTLHPVQEAWIDEQVPQCGYCQSGQIMNAISLLNESRSPDDSDIDKAMSGNLCRCGTYVRIRKAIKRAVTNGNNLNAIPNE